MADTTISQLPILTPSANALIPFSQGGTTYATKLSALDTNRFYVKANCSNTAIMPNLNSDFIGNQISVLPINAIVNSGTNPIWSSALNTNTNSISVPYNGLYYILCTISGYVSEAKYAMRACAIYFDDISGGGSTGIEGFGYFNCPFINSNTHFIFQPYTVTYLNANTLVRARYQLFTQSGTNAALDPPISHGSYLHVIQL